MTEEAKKARREYQRQRRAKNRDKVREANRRYWERKAEELQAGEQVTDDGKSDKQYI